MSPSCCSSRQPPWRARRCLSTAVRSREAAEVQQAAALPPAAVPVAVPRPATGPLVALTFDDGPSPQRTGYVLEVLKQKGVTATFFLQGSNAAEHPDLVRRIRDEGHVIGNHAYSHAYFPELTQARAREEITRTQRGPHGDHRYHADALPLPARPVVRNGGRGARGRRSSPAGSCGTGTRTCRATSSAPAPRGCRSSSSPRPPTRPRSCCTTPATPSTARSSSGTTCRRPSTPSRCAGSTSAWWSRRDRPSAVNQGSWVRVAVPRTGPGA